MAKNEDYLKFQRTAWLHVKSQGLYQIDDIMLNESDLMPTVAYHKLGDDEGPRFLRPWWEFFDGRFTQYNVEGVGGEIDKSFKPSRDAVKPKEKKSAHLAHDTTGRLLHAGDHVNHVGFPRGQVMGAEEANNWGDYGKRTVAEIFSTNTVKLLGTPNVIWDSRGLELVPFDD